jgi:cytoskeletal protein CcmA (bactofilin family)
MFSSRKEAPAQLTKGAPAQGKGNMPMPPPQREMPARPSIISEGTIIFGGIKTAGDIQIDGRIEGDLYAASATLGSSAVLNGNLFAQTADVRGRVEGDCYAHHLKLASGGHINGNLACRTFEVEHGAKLEGTCRHPEDPLAAGTRFRESATMRNVVPAAPIVRAPVAMSAPMSAPASAPQPMPPLAAKAVAPAAE